MSRYRISAVSVSLAASLFLAGCGTSTPMVGSQRATTQDLLADLRSVGVCQGNVEFREGSGLFDVVGAGGVFTRCDGSYAISFFPPGDGITTVFSPQVCKLNYSDQPATQVVWGSNWVVSALNEEAERKMGDIADVTMGGRTTTQAMYTEFCKVLNG